jgi:hypothetical protein
MLEIFKQTKTHESIQELQEECETKNAKLTFDEMGKPCLEVDGEVMVNCTQIVFDGEHKEISIHYPFSKEKGKGYGTIYYYLIAKHYQKIGYTLTSRTLRKPDGSGLWRRILTKGLATYDLNRNVFQFIELPDETTTQASSESLKTNPIREKVLKWLTHLNP